MANLATKYPTVGPRWGEDALPPTLSSINAAAVSAQYRDSSICSVMSNEEMHKIENIKPLKTCTSLSGQSVTNSNTWSFPIIVHVLISSRKPRLRVKYPSTLPNLVLWKQVPVLNSTVGEKPLLWKSGSHRLIPLSLTDPRLVFPRCVTNYFTM